jgi:outer membrane biosynthesis protein TonB
LLAWLGWESTISAADFTQPRGFQMRKLFLIAAITLASTAANAGPSRGLSLASAEATQPVAEQPKTQTAAPATTAERAKPAVPQEAAKDPAKTDKPADAAKPTRKHVSTEARIIYELHRHGIYW